MVELRGCEANIIINAASGIQPGNYDSVFYWEQVQEYKIKEVAHFRFTIIRDIYCQEILLSSALVHMCFFCIVQFVGYNIVRKNDQIDCIVYLSCFENNTDCDIQFFSFYRNCQIQNPTQCLRNLELLRKRVCITWKL